MIKEQIQECIQRILDNELGGISTNNCPRGGIEKYRYMTAYRLSKYVNFYRTHRISLDDLLISLRNYLLVFQTAVRLPIDIDITDNKYGLRIDSEGLCYATLNLPEYLNVDIIKQGFMEDYIEPKKDERYFLGVTPNIYRLTGFQRFKSIRQKLAVNGALNMPEGYTALVSLPTGGGKSLITQTMAYQKKDGLTITVVPTVSLAMDQVRVAKDNIRVASKAEIACYYSDLASEEKRSIIDRIKNRKLRLLFISPEALISDNTELIGNVINRGFSTVIINDDDQSSYFNLLNSISEWTDVNFLGMNEFVRLVEHGDYYFFAGDAVVLYGNKDSGIYKKISRLRKSLQTGEIRLLHVFKENIFCNEIGKTVSSIVDGPVLEEYLIERM